MGGAGRIRKPGSTLRARTPRAREVRSSGVVLAWAGPGGKRKAASYRVFRDGKLLGRTRTRRFTDRKPKPGRTHRYAVAAYDRRGKRIGLPSKTLKVKVPARPAPRPGPATPGAAPTANPVPALPAVGPPAGAGPSSPTLSEAMVDRVFWRAGFGPSAADRARWSGRPLDELVDWLLDTPPSYASAVPAPKSSSGAAIDPLASDDELCLEWVERMARADNPLPERLALFLHSLWAVSNEDGIDLRFMVRYRDRLRRFANLAANPSSYRDLAWEMTTADPAMAIWLDQRSNTRYGPNENYAREFMELFCLGVNAPDGTPNYSQADVVALTRAFTGWRLQGDDMQPNYGAITFSQNHWASGTKVLSWRPGQPIQTAAQGVDAVFAHPQHAGYLVRRLWGELIGGSIPADALASLIEAYRSSGFQLRPVVRGILRHPQLVAELDAPSIPKSPVVFAAGVIRALEAPLRGGHVPSALSAMQQRPFRPPNVAGWEGGLSWFNTNTVQARFDLVKRVQWLKHSTHYDGTARLPAVVPGETGAAAFERAYAAAGRPWLAPATRSALLSVAAALPATNDGQRRQRLYTLQALVLGGPDGQVC